MWLRCTCDLRFDIAVPTPFALMLRPQSGAHQWVAREEWELTPCARVRELTDGYGNLCQRLLASPGPFSVHAAAEVATPDNVDEAPGAPFVEVQDLPDSALAFLLPSRYCECERFHGMASEITLGSQPGYDQVARIVTWLRDAVVFEPGSSPTAVSAVEVNERRWGVCRDLAHLGIALVRSLAVPARLVVGYLYGLCPMDMHAWFEAYVGDRWYTFDPSRPSLRGGYVAIGYGRDAADVAVYTQFGPTVYPTSQTVTVQQMPAR